MSRALQAALSTALTVGLLGWAAWYLRDHAGQLAPLLEMSLLTGAVLLAAAWLYMYAQGLLLRDVVAASGIALQPREWFGCVVVTMMWNYLLPFAGIGFRALYLQRAHGLELRDFVAGTTGIFILEVLVFGLFGLVGFAATANLVTEVPRSTLLVLAGAGLAAIAALLVRAPQWQLPGRVGRSVSALLEAWNGFRSNRPLLVRGLGWNLLVFAAYCAMYVACFDAIRLPLGVLDSFIVAAISDISLVVRVTPGSVGTFDASVILALRMSGASLASGLLVASLMRIASVFWLVILGPLYHHRLTGSPAFRDGVARNGQSPVT